VIRKAHQTELILSASTSANGTPSAPSGLQRELRLEDRHDEPIAHIKDLTQIISV
jgi:hypothetical protein